EIAANLHAVAAAQPLLRDRSCGHADRRLARRGAAAAGRAAHAVLLKVGVVRMPGPEFLGDRGIILRALVFVADEKADRRAGGAALKDAGEELDRVGFAPLGDMARAAGFAPIQFALNISGGELHARRTAIDHAAVRRPVRLAERGDAVKD